MSTMKKNCTSCKHCDQSKMYKTCKLCDQYFCNWEFKNKPWENEKDLYKFKIGKYKCIIRRTDNGYLCGYVGIKNDHPLYNKDLNWSVLEKEITYTDRSNDFLHYDNIDENLWFIGFHCGERFDYIPFPPTKDWNNCGEFNYKTVNFVKRNIVNLIKLLKEKEDKNEKRKHF